MQTDLFAKPKSMRERILEFAKQKGFITSIDLDNLPDEIKQTEGNIRGILRIPKEARDLVKEGLLRRLDDDEKIFRGFDKRFATYEYIAK